MKALQKYSMRNVAGNPDRVRRRKQLSLFKPMMISKKKSKELCQRLVNNFLTNSK